VTTPKNNVRSRPNPPTGSEFNLEHVTKQARRLPNRVVLHALEGWGKTSFGAQTPDPIFLMTSKETGLWTLMDAGQLQENVAHFPRAAESWLDVNLAVSQLIVNEHPYKTLVLDTMNGAERLLHDDVCQKKFDGDWGERGFLGYDRGPRMAIPEWVELLKKLDRLREKGMSILLLCHTAVSNFKNPEGPDYDRFVPAVNKATWAETHKWADMVLFGNFETLVDTAKAKDTKGKAKGGQTRLILTERHASYDAKNRHGLPPEIECGDTAEQAWANFVEALAKK